MFDENEKPLDRIVSDGGFCGIFRTIACVGDSLSSGEFEAVTPDGVRNYYDIFDFSWGQYLARMAGTTVYNFSRGGMTARAYMQEFAESKGYWAPELAASAYIIALGCNDLWYEKQDIGSTADICPEDYNKNTQNFAGWYSAVVARYREISPDSRLFFVTMLYEGDAEKDALCDRHAELLYSLAEYFGNAYVIDLRKYMCPYDEFFKSKFYLEGHLNPCGYILTAKIIASYIDYIIRHNMKDFERVGFFNTPFSDSKMAQLQAEFDAKNK